MARVLEEEINSLHAGICAGLADPKRIMILYELADGPKNVTDLAKALGMPASPWSPAISRFCASGAWSSPPAMAPPSCTAWATRA